MKDKPNLESQLKHVLDQSADDLPESVQKKLAEARAKAVLANHTKTQSFGWTKELVAVAACVALVVPIWFGLKNTQEDSFLQPQGLDLMVSFAELDEEEWELVDDLEFALWLSEQSSLANKNKPS